MGPAQHLSFDATPFRSDFVGTYCTNVAQRYVLQRSVVRHDYRPVGVGSRLVCTSSVTSGTGLQMHDVSDFELSRISSCPERDGSNLKLPRT
jgi:hypothetical protein